ncbi:hypothetical protein [Cellulomonas sp. URHB0016]
MPVLAAVLVALIVAAAVLLVASAVGGRAPEEHRRSPLRTFQAGLSARRHPDEEQREAAVAASAEPVDVSLDEFLNATTDRGSAYLDVEELGATLHRARERAARVLPLPRRS